LRIELGITKEHLDLVYNDSYILENLSQDNRKIEPIINPLVTYYSAFNGDEFMGCFMHIKFTIYEVELHSLLLKKAIKNSRTFGKMIIDETFKDETVLRITANIIGDLKKSINYCKKLGFRQEGIKKHSILKNGIITNVNILGLTREEWSKK